MSASSHNAQRECRQTLTHETTSRGKLARQGGNPVPVRGQEYGAPDMTTPPAKGLCNSLILRRRLSQMHLLHTCATASLRVTCLNWLELRLPRTLRSLGFQQPIKNRSANLEPSVGLDLGIPGCSLIPWRLYIAMPIRTRDVAWSENKLKS